MKTLHTWLALCAMLLTFSACTDQVKQSIDSYSDEELAILSEDLNLPEELYDYNNDMSSMGVNIDTEAFTKINNLRNNHIATLGRVLFYDKALSIDNTVSCASCHDQSLAFADNKKFSEGVNGEVTFRNSLPLGNTVGFEVAYGGGNSFHNGSVTSFEPTALFGWDEANHNISSQSEAAILSQVEMGMHNMAEVRAKLLEIDYYQVLFKKAFGESEVSEHDILFSLDRFVNSITSKASKFDIEGRNMTHGDFIDPIIDFDGFTASENRGKKLFNTNCASCHSHDHMFTAVSVANNGLDLDYSDKGKYEHTGVLTDDGMFKVPFLRNIALTGPYMHDGRFESLEEVVRFYSSGIQNHQNLSPQLKRFDQNTPKRLNFSDSEVEDLVNYLHTLTDESLAKELKWSDPFRS